MAEEGVSLAELTENEPSVGRLVRMTANPGEGDDLAQALLRVADNMRQAPGCQMYLVSMSAKEPDTVWITELWTDIMSSDLALGGKLGEDGVKEVMEHLAGPPDLVPLLPLGGPGYPPGPR